MDDCAAHSAAWVIDRRTGLKSEETPRAEVEVRLRGAAAALRRLAGLCGPAGAP